MKSMVDAKKNQQAVSRGKNKLFDKVESSDHRIKRFERIITKKPTWQYTD